MDSASPVSKQRPVSPTTEPTAAAIGTGAGDGKMLDDLLAPLEAGGEDEVRIEEEPDVEDEAEPLTIAKDHKLPSAEAVEEHRCLHIPYRAWCKRCVMGQGRGGQHRPGPESTTPTIGMEY